MDFTTHITYAIEVWFLDGKNTKTCASTLLLMELMLKRQTKVLLLATTEMFSRSGSES